MEKLVIMFCFVVGTRAYGEHEYEGLYIAISQKLWILNMVVVGGQTHVEFE